MTSSSLRDRLAEYFMNRHVRRLATAAPFGFDVGLVAGVLGCVVALPGFAASGFGIIAAGLAINRVSSYLDRLAAPALGRCGADRLYGPQTADYDRTACVNMRSSGALVPADTSGGLRRIRPTPPASGHLAEEH